MKNNNKKKAFTIVELVIVIAVIGILSSILIPTFSELIGKAKNTKDITTITNLNKMIVISDLTEKEFKTPSDLFNNMEEFSEKSIKLENKNYSVAWNSYHDQIVIFDENYNIIAPENFEDNEKSHYWIFSNNYDSDLANQGYGFYILDGYTGGDIEATSNIDVGNNEINITYTGSSRKSIVKTNGGNLIIDNEYADLTHYGECDTVTIKKCAMSSYYENGIVNDVIEISVGHLVINNDAQISEIVICGNSDENGQILVDIGSQKAESINITKQENVTFVSDIKINKGNAVIESIENISVKTNDDDNDNNNNEDDENNNEEQSIKYTLTFDTSGGSEIASQEYSVGETINKPDNPTKEGYNFNGWSPEIPETMPEGDLTVTAQWTETPHEVNITIKEIKNEIDNENKYVTFSNTSESVSTGSSYENTLEFTDEYIDANKKFYLTVKMGDEYITESVYTHNTHTILIETVTDDIEIKLEVKNNFNQNSKSINYNFNLKLDDDGYKIDGGLKIYFKKSTINYKSKDDVIIDFSFGIIALTHEQINLTDCFVADDEKLEIDFSKIINNTYKSNSESFEGIELAGSVNIDIKGMLISLENGGIVIPVFGTSIEDIHAINIYKQ